MGHKEEIIVRGAVGILVGLALNSFLTSISQDIIAPIIKQKSFDDLQHKFVLTVGGIRIHYGDLIGHFISMIVILASVYVTLHYMEKYKIL